MLTIAAMGQTLNVRVGNVTYQFPATQTGEMTYAAGETVTIMGKTFPLADIDGMTVDDTDVTNNLVAIAYSTNGDATVTVCHSRTRDLTAVTLQADIIVAALGIPRFLKGNQVKEGAVVIDVGTTRVPDANNKTGFRLNGDVKFDEVAPKCEYITPVPGGVGPMTICSLMNNTLAAAKKSIYTD